MTGEEQAVEYEIDVQDASFRPERQDSHILDAASTTSNLFCLLSVYSCSSVATALI